mmetsp:Transcript_16263/g.50922  ORF Transcript_16263/g.50922 Transcript_16263/m.50922 type:complete len:85 (+) Transcript_16263:278-532(+)
MAQNAMLFSLDGAIMFMQAPCIIAAGTMQACITDGAVPATPWCAPPLCPPFWTMLAGKQTGTMPCGTMPAEFIPVAAFGVMLPS